MSDQGIHYDDDDDGLKKVESHQDKNSNSNGGRKHKDIHIPYMSRLFKSSYVTCWSLDDEYRSHMPKKHSDYRDKLPVPIEDLQKEYARFIKSGQWTFGLLDMWCPRSKVVKHSVHVPCWDSFKILPWKWRGCVFGRNCRECYWFGLRETRWARTAYAGNLGREYVLPVRGVGTHGYKSEIEALCWMTWILGCLMGCGIGQVLSILGNAGINFAAPYTCHTRSRMRYKYGLPPVCCMPLGIDDFLVHCFCFYCASHQEMRELVARGVDGPGLHTMDVHPQSYAHNPGYEEALKKRRRKVQLMWLSPPPQYDLNREEKYPDIMSAVIHSMMMAMREACKHGGRAMVGRAHRPMVHEKSSKNLGWFVGMEAPVVQEMNREIVRTYSDPTMGEFKVGGEVDMVPVIEEKIDAYDGKAWSVAY